MKRAIVLMSCAGWLAFSQSPESPRKFEAADVRVSAKTANPFVRTGAARGGRYEVKDATMVDLIRIAYGFDADKVLGGPSWLEMDRFDVTAKVPADTTPEALNAMLQPLLEDRFKLVVHKDTRPLPAYALTAGKKPQLKPAEGTEEAGCRPQSAGTPVEGGIRLMTTNQSGATTTFNLGPGMTIHYNCRNMTMAAFAEGLRGMMGASVGTNPVLDETGLKGKWNFNVDYSLQLIGPMMANTGDRVTIFEALDKQLGLKLEERQVPTPVIVVDRVNEKPSENPPGTAEVLPVIPAPTEFDVASVKPAAQDVGMSNFRIQPGGRLDAKGMPLGFLIRRAFNTNNNDAIAGLPAWVDAARFDIVAKAPSEGPSAPALDMESMAPMIRALLADRFKMAWHTEDRPVAAYSLVAAKPRMKKADPASRAFCKSGPAPAAPGSILLTCQRLTREQLVDRLHNMAAGLNWPVRDATGIEGGWDFTLTWIGAMRLAAGRGGDAGQAAGDAPAASDPTGGYTIFEAIEKQLGLKLEAQKRPMPVIVIDHIEQTPTEN